MGQNMAWFSDFKFDLELNDYKDLTVIEDIDSVRQAIICVLMTKRGNRPMDPLFGSNVHRFLMEKISGSTEILLRNEIQTTIGNYEPRVDLLDVIVNADEANNTYVVDIYYRLKNLGLTDQLTITLSVVE
jgi:phage baseplate assembly protein W